MNLYDILGVDKGASPSDIKAAYRKLAQKHHPDRQDGDAERFKEIQRAYDILGDENKRERYDETGDTEEPDSVRKQAMSNLAALVLHVVDQAENVETTPIKTLMIDTINMNVKEVMAGINMAKRKIEKREKAILRFKKTKRVEEDMILEFLRGDIRAQQNAIKQAELTVEICDEMKKIIEDYDYNIDASAVKTNRHSHPFQRVVFTGF